MTQIVTYPLHQLRNDEFPDVVEYVLEIAAKHFPAELKIEGFYNLLLEKRSLLDNFSEKSEPLAYKDMINDERVQRMELIRAILLHMKAADKAAIISLTDARAKVNPWVENHLADLKTQNLKVINRKTGDFLREYDENTELASAATELGVHVYVDKLKMLQQSLKTNGALRTADNATKRSVDRQSNKKELILALKNFFSAIDLAQVEHTAIDYTPLINELGEFLVTYRTLVKSRGTRAKKSADNKATTAELSTTTSPAAI